MDPNKIANFKDNFEKIILKNKTAIICPNPIIFLFNQTKGKTYHK